MNVIMFMAMSLDGKTAKEDDSEDFLADKNWDTFKELAEKAGCFIVGRRTDEAVSAWEGYSFSDVNAKKIVVSRDGPVSSPSHALREAGDREQVILAGGSRLNASFIDEGLVDEIIINIEPVLIGLGKGLLSGKAFERRLELMDTKTLDHGIVQLRYRA